MIKPIDTRARWIELLANLYAETYAFAFELGADTSYVLKDIAAELGISEAKFRRWLDASPDLRAAFVAKGWQP